MRRMKTEWELVNYGEVQRDGNVLLDHTFELLEGDYLIWYDNLEQNVAGQSTFILTKEIVASTKEFDDLLINVEMGNILVLTMEFDAKAVFDIFLNNGGKAADSGVVYIYKKS